MAAPNDESLPLEYSESSAKRRAPKKLQSIGLGQFRNQGVAHHLQPGSAAAIFNKQKAEQRMEEWLRGKPVEKEKGKKKAKKSAKSRKGEAALATTKDGGVEGSTGDLSTGPTVAVAQMGQGKAPMEQGKTQNHEQGGVSTVTKAPTRKKVIKIVTVDRRIKPAQGAWGQRAVENAKNAAPKAVATSYSTTPISIDVADGEAFATVTPTIKLPTPEPMIPRAAAAQPKTATTKTIPNKTVRKPATKSRALKKSQAPMWSEDDSDEDGQDEDEINDLLLSSRPAASTTKAPRGRTTKNSNLRKKPTQDQPTPQKQKEKKKRQVHFAPPTASPEEGDETTSSSTNVNTSLKQNNESASQKKKQQQPTHVPPTPYTTLSLPRANFHIPSQPQPPQTPADPANLADDENSQILSAKNTPTSTQKKPKTPTPNIQKPTFTHNPSSAAAKKQRAQEKQQQQQQQQQEQPPPPPRKIGVAHPPQPKRARATTNDDDHNDSAHDSAAPVSKKAKTTAETSKPTKKEKPDLPARKKKGVATKVKAKRARAVVSDDSDDDDGE